MIKMIFGRDRKEEYIDLEEYGGGEKKEAKMFVKVAEIQSYDDVKDFASYVYEGNLLILDVSPISIDDIELERVINEFKRIIQDIDGDIAGMDRNHIIVTPSGVKIDRRKIRKF
ncbi:MAG: cell division protein SepF [Thermoplasmata archaeon]|nr:cell division protein SepF [Thermoplasmata archaeon]